MLTRGIGIGLIAVGLILTYNLFGSPANRLGGHTLDALMFFGPVILAAGILLMYRPKAGTPPESANAKTLLYVGVACVVISAILLRTVAILGVLSVALLGLPGLVLLATSPLIPRFTKIIGGIALAIPAGFMIVAVMSAMPKGYKSYVPMPSPGTGGTVCAPVQFKIANYHETIDEKSGYVYVTGTIFNTCPQAAAVQMRVVAVDQSGAVLETSDFWASRGSYIPAGGSLSFNSSLRFRKGAKVSVFPLAVRRW
jgi:hypothetical protein